MFQERKTHDYIALELTLRTRVIGLTRDPSPTLHSRPLPTLPSHEMRQHTAHCHVSSVIRLSLSHTTHGSRLKELSILRLYAQLKGLQVQLSALQPLTVS